MNLVWRLLSPEYWVVTEPGALGRAWVAYGLLGLAFAAGMVLAARLLLAPAARRAGGGTAPSTRAGARQLYAWFELGACTAGLLAVIGRILDWPGWSARIWPASLAALALAGAAAYRARSRSIPACLLDPLRILALLPPLWAQAAAGQGSSPVGGHRRQVLRALGRALGWGVHLAGIAFLLEARFGIHWWLAPPVLLALLAPQLPVLIRRRAPSLAALAPLLAGYLAALLGSAYSALGITIVGWQGLAFPDPMTSLFYADGILLGGLAYSSLCQLFFAHSSLARQGGPGPTVQARSAGAWRWAASLLLLASSAWAVTVYLGKRTHGVTGSDPYAYAQMAVDLAGRGTFLHRFALFPEVVPLGIAWGPLLPTGYHLPVNEHGDAPSVWATGASVLLAGGVLLLGEAGLYITTPVIALLALGATWALAVEALRGESRAVRYLAAALTTALTATSPEWVDRLLVPMADAAAQLFTLLTLLFCLRAMRHLPQSPRRALPPLILGGMAFAWAYWVRHTQLVLLLPVAAGLWTAGRRRAGAAPRPASPLQTAKAALRSSPIWPVLAFSGAAAVMAIPDAVYRWRVFGGILATETTELPSMGVQHIGPMALQTLRDMLVAGEWGYLFPLAAIGGWLLFRHNRRAFAVLGGAFLVVLLVHLTYRFLRLRDLISLFPLVNLAVSYGAVGLVRTLRRRALHGGEPRRLGPALRSGAAVAWVVLALALARWTMIDDLWKPGWASFGYVRPDQRAAFDRLAELTPPGAVIGTSLNAGAIALLSGPRAS